MRAGKERHLPKPQRRGAIIILGMLAVAKRSVLTDKVDVMLKIGLGPLGRVGTLLFYYLFTLCLIYYVTFLG
jgi:condensin complex subunit 1